MTIELRVEKFSSSGGAEYVAPSIGKIAVSIDFLTGSISNPFLWLEHNWNSRTRPEFWGLEMRLDLGSYIQESELQEIIGTIRPLVETASAGYLGGGDECSASFTESAQKAIEQIPDAVEMIDRPITEPSNAHDVLFDQSWLDGEEIGAGTADEQLVELSYSYAAETVLPFHPWDGFDVLCDVREQIIEASEDNA